MEHLSRITQKLQKRHSGPSGAEQPPSARDHTLPTEESSTLHPKATDDKPNVIIFGETGVGKSSLINMIAPTASAAVSNAAIGCTFESVPYDAELSDHKYRLWDTAGLNEGEYGNVSADRAIESLQELVQSLKDGGVSLLVYCIRGSRLRDIVKINYDIFHTIICDGKVPIVVVITGLENEDDMEDWWLDNASDFDRRGMQFRGHACITTTKGKIMKSGEHMFQEEYNRSVELVREVIVAKCAESAWKPDSSKWLGNIVEKMRQMYAESGNHAQDYAPGLDSPAVAERSSVKPASYTRIDYPQNASKVQEYASSVNSPAIVDGSRGELGAVRETMHDRSSY